jgi:D-glycero-beta-D-manno-heptose 1-phosphate adenylyltransferase
MSEHLKFTHKVVSRQDLQDFVAQIPRPMVMTNGVFDILHVGHVTYLEEARRLGASLVVAINTDASVKGLGKGDERPINKEADRAAVLAALESVSVVTFFGERTPVELMAELRPDVYVKGGDYDMETLAETKLVRSWGGHAQALPFVNGYSTTSTVKKMKGDGK